jgi:hypothetical protein
MKLEDFEIQAKDAAKAMNKKKAPTKPETQFIKGALWAWEMLMTAKAPIYYETKLRAEVMARLGDEGMRENEGWIDSLIEETAEKMARLDAFRHEIEETGYLIEKIDKNMNAYKESNPLLVHMKELDRTIGMQREHLGLSFKVNPNRMKESPKQGDMEKDPMYQFVKGRKK